MALIQAEGVKGSSVCPIYTRQSSNTHSALTSCQMQFEACEAFIRAHKHNGWRWIEEHFNDEGWSGASLDRPALERLLVKVRNGEIDRLLVYRLDRLSRSVVDSVSLLKEFRERGIDLVIVTAPEIGSTAHISLILNLLSIFAEFERDLVAKRIADARAAGERKREKPSGAQRRAAAIRGPLARSWRHCPILSIWARLTMPACSAMGFIYPSCPKPYLAKFARNSSRGVPDLLAERNAPNSGC